MRPNEIWLFLLFIGVLALNWPFLAIFKNHLPAYLFAAWLCLIAIIYLIIGKATKDEDGG